MRPLKAIRGGLARRPQQLSRSWPLRRPFSDHNGVAGRRWSTPLAKTLAEAVTVSCHLLPHDGPGCALQYH